MSFWVKIYYSLAIYIQHCWAVFIHMLSDYSVRMGHELEKVINRKVVDNWTSFPTRQEPSQSELCSSRYGQNTRLCSIKEFCRIIMFPTIRTSSKSIQFSSKNHEIRHLVSFHYMWLPLIFVFDFDEVSIDFWPFERLSHKSDSKRVIKVTQNAYSANSGILSCLTWIFNFPTSFKSCKDHVHAFVHIFRALKLNFTIWRA